MKSLCGCVWKESQCWLHTGMSALSLPDLPFPFHCCQLKMAVCLLRQPLCLLWATEQEDGMILSTDSPFQHQPGPFLPRADLPFLCLKPWPTGHETSSSISPGAWLHQRGGHPRCWWKGLIARMGKRSYSGNDFLINTHWKQLIFSWWFYFLPGRDSYFDCVYKAPTAALADRASHWWLDLAHFSPGSDYLRVGTTNPYISGVHCSLPSTLSCCLPCHDDNNKNSNNYS